MVYWHSKLSLSLTLSLHKKLSLCVSHYMPLIRSQQEIVRYQAWAQFTLHLVHSVCQYKLELIT